MVLNCEKRIFVSLPSFEDVIDLLGPPLDWRVVVDDRGSDFPKPPEFFKA